MAQPAQPPQNVWVSALPVRADDRHLLCSGADADAQAPEEGPGVPVGARRSATGSSRPSGIYGQVTKLGRAPCSSRSPTRCASTSRAPRSAAIRDRSRSSSRTSGRALDHVQEPPVEAPRRSPSSPALAIWSFYAAQSQKIKLGLDLKGGVHLVLKVQTDDALQARDGDRAPSSCAKRSKTAGITSAAVQVDGLTEFTVEGVPPASDQQFRTLADQQVDRCRSTATSRARRHLHVPDEAEHRRCSAAPSR